MRLEELSALQSQESNPKTAKSLFIYLKQSLIIWELLQGPYKQISLFVCAHFERYNLDRKGQLIRMIFLSGTKKILRKRTSMKKNKIKKPQWTD